MKTGQGLPNAISARPGSSWSTAISILPGSWWLRSDWLTEVICAQSSSCCKEVVCVSWKVLCCVNIGSSKSLQRISRTNFIRIVDQWIRHTTNTVELELFAIILRSLLSIHVTRCIDTYTGQIARLTFRIDRFYGPFIHFHASNRFLFSDIHRSCL